MTEAATFFHFSSSLQTQCTVIYQDQAAWNYCYLLLLYILFVFHNKQTRWTNNKLMQKSLEPSASYVQCVSLDFPSFASVSWNVISISVAFISRYNETEEIQRNTLVSKTRRIQSHTVHSCVVTFDWVHSRRQRTNHLWITLIRNFTFELQRFFY